MTTARLKLDVNLNVRKYKQQTIALKMAARNFVTRCIVLFNGIPIESLRIRNLVHLGKKSSPPSLAQSSIVQCLANFACKMP